MTAKFRFIHNVGLHENLLFFSLKNEAQVGFEPGPSNAT